MKNIIILFLTSLLLISCTDKEKERIEAEKREKRNQEIAKRAAAVNKKIKELEKYGISQNEKGELVNKDGKVIQNIHAEIEKVKKEQGIVTADTKPKKKVEKKTEKKDAVVADRVGKNNRNEKFEILKPYRYDPVGKRDPFYNELESVAKKGAEDLENPLEGYDLDQLNLVGVIWGKQKRAMVKDPKGNIYHLRKNDRLGINGGRVDVIREGEVVVIEKIHKHGQRKYTARVLRISEEGVKK